MSYSAKVFRVLIASPSDVKNERKLISEIVYEWNAINSQKQEIVVLPVKWETHSSPHMGGRPQEIINRQIVDFCDLLVVVFWTRIGSPTEVADSGTIEEIERFLESGKPVMLYFSSVPVVPENIDQKQYSRLIAFKDKCSKDGLIETYESLEDFNEKFKRQFAIKLHNLSLGSESNAEYPELTSHDKGKLGTALSYNEIIQIVLNSDSRNDWIRTSKSMTTSTTYFKKDVNLRFEVNYEGEGIQNDDYKEEWANKHLHPRARGYYYDLYYGATLVERFILVSVDEGNAMLPRPRLGTNTVKLLDYKVAQIHDAVQSLDQYMMLSGLVLAEE